MEENKIIKSDDEQVVESISDYNKDFSEEDLNNIVENEGQVEEYTDEIIDNE